MRTGAWLASHGAVRRSYDSRPDEDGKSAFRSGCSGKVEVLIEPVTPVLAELIGLAAQHTDREQRVALATVIGSSSPLVRVGERLFQSRSGSVSRVTDTLLAWKLSEASLEALAASEPGTGYCRHGSIEALIEVIEPEPHLFVFGAGEDVLPLASFARQLGWQVTVCTTRRHFAVRDRFSGVAELRACAIADSVEQLDRCARPLAVVMAHDYEQDREALGALLQSEARYIGVLGPARRTARMLEELQADRAVPKPRLTRVYGPAGLYLGAETQAAVALSIVAEAQAVLAKAEGGSLRERAAGIHQQPASLRLLQAEGA